MESCKSAIHSEYLIDGVRYKITPYEMLETACGRTFEKKSLISAQTIVDENIDNSPIESTYIKKDIFKYLNSILESDENNRTIPIHFIEDYTKWIIATSIIDTLWYKGCFKLEDVKLQIKWRWNPKPIGNMAAFYHSVEAACEYIEGLGIGLENYSYEEGIKNKITVDFIIDKSNKFEQNSYEDLFKQRKINFNKSRACKKTLSGDTNSWIIFVPFDTCNFKLGTSFLNELQNKNTLESPKIRDTYYFIDCYELLRELVEDRIILSAATIKEGGLMPSLKKLLGDKYGMNADISGIIKSYNQKDLISILFSEIPGAIIEITDSDYDYIDAECLLQDIAYYPLGQISKRSKQLNFITEDKNSISSILQSLLNGQAIEGED